MTLDGLFVELRLRTRYGWEASLSDRGTVKGEMRQKKKGASKRQPKVLLVVYGTVPEVVWPMQSHILVKVVRNPYYLSSHNRCRIPHPMCGSISAARRFCLFDIRLSIIFKVFIQQIL